MQTNRKLWVFLIVDSEKRMRSNHQQRRQQPARVQLPAVLQSLQEVSCGLSTEKWQEMCGVMQQMVTAEKGVSNRERIEAFVALSEARKVDIMAGKVVLDAVVMQASTQAAADDEVVERVSDEDIAVGIQRLLEDHSPSEVDEVDARTDHNGEVMDVGDVA
jgi:hypothetical protein